MTEKEQNIYKNFLLVAHLEGISFLLLLGVAMPLKHFFKLPLAVSLAGMVHGVLFIAFCAMLYQMLVQVKWSFWKCTKAFILGFLPFGTFFIHKLD